MAGRPKSADPAVAMSVYPARSVREKIEAVATKERRKVGEMAVILIEEALALRGKKAKAS